MNKLVKIKLINWQKHDELELDLTPDLNIITGVTDTGKTCIFRALEWIYGFSNISEKDYRREGSDETSVQIFFDNGFIVERIRSNSLNRYIIKKEGCENQQFDAIGKDVPEEVKQILEIEEVEIDGQKISLNFAEQENLNFILDDSVKPSFRAKLFNKFTGHEIMDKLFKHLNKEALSLSKSIKANEQEIIKNKDSLIVTKKDRDKVQEILNNAKSIFNEIENDLTYYEELNQLAKKLSTNTENEKIVKEKLDKVVIISKSTIEETKKVLENYNQLKKIDSLLSTVNNKLSELDNSKSKIKDCEDIDFKQLKEESNKFDILFITNSKLEKINKELQVIENKKDKIKIVKLDDLTSLKNKYEELNKIKIKLSCIEIEETKTKEKIKSIQEDLKSNSDKLKLIWDELGNVCPTCKQKVCSHE